MPTASVYIRTDDHGVMWVGKSRVMLDSIVAAFEQGHSAETIQQQYPVLSLEEVYGAIAWYLANHAEVTRYLERQNAVWKRWRAKAAEQPSPVVQRLRKLQRNNSSEPSWVGSDSWPTTNLMNTLSSAFCAANPLLNSAVYVSLG